MNSLFERQPNGYQDRIRRGLDAVRRFSGVSTGAGSAEERIECLKKAIAEADAIVVGAGAGLSTAAGLTYSGERFERYFSDFAEKFSIRDMYSGGFYPFPDQETFWAWWARHIYFNRFIDAPKPVYPMLLKALQGRESFVITTNVDHQFQRAGFDKRRLFYTQGDYGLFQPADGRVKETYDNEAWTMRAMEAQGFVRGDDGVFRLPENGSVRMKLPTELIPTAPNGGAVKMNLRADSSFVEDDGWRAASAAYADFLKRHARDRVLYWELGVGANTPVIIKYPFWQMIAENPKAVYACTNFNEAFCPKEIESRSICIDGDAGDVLRALVE